jgi:metal-responsive CopG/Arc/MetJ family transcriptional regulator
MKEIKIMSLSLEPEMHELIKNSAKKLGHKNVSQLIRDLVSKYLDLLVNDNEDIPVILRIPNGLKENREQLKSWLDQKSEAITNALTENENSTT